MDTFGKLHSVQLNTEDGAQNAQERKKSKLRTVQPYDVSIVTTTEKLPLS